MSIAKEIKDIDEASALLEKIAVIVCGASNPNQAFRALAMSFGFVLSKMNEHDRRNAAKALKRFIPELLDITDKTAADAEADKTAADAEGKVASFH